LLHAAGRDKEAQAMEARIAAIRAAPAPVGGASGATR
jgi:hypothetical protein